MAYRRTILLLFALPTAFTLSVSVLRAQEAEYSPTQRFTQHEGEQLQPQHQLQYSSAGPVSRQEVFLDLTSEVSSQQTAGSDVSVGDSGADVIIRLVTWTVIVLCLCVLTVLGLRRWQSTHGLLPAAPGVSKVLETVSLGSNRSVSLVQLRHIQAVVGCDSSGIRSIVLALPSFEQTLSSYDDDPDETN